MKKLLLVLFLTFPVLLSAQVTIRDTSVTWHTFQYELNSDNTINWKTDTQYDTVSRTFSGFILENEYLKITLVPEFGGRILSMIYKPTGREELYQNPAGAPYGVGEEWFYYKWLMVYGGIFPTLPEPEHGKAWFLPWDFTLLKETTDTISCMMSWTDTVQLEGINEGKWKYGKTNLRCNFTVTLIKGRSSLEADISLINDSNENLEYEYWTCLTLAPGSEPGNSQCSEGAELIIPASKLKIPSWYPDIAAQEQRISGQPGYYTFTKLRQWKNWTNDGIAYPWDDPNKNFWGVINQDNKEGLIRIADNEVTHGIKIWAWGYEQSQDIDPFKDPDVSRRPYVELWAGHSNEFFAPAVINMNSGKEWKEFYIPATGLSNVTHATNEIIANLFIDSGKTVSLEFAATYPRNTFELFAEIKGQFPQILLNQNIIPDPENGNSVTANLPENIGWSEVDSLVCKITNLDNGSDLIISVPLDTLTILAVNSGFENITGYYLAQNYPNPFNPVTTIKYHLPDAAKVSLKIYDMLGKEVSTLVNNESPAGNFSVTFDGSQSASGIYYCRFNAGNFSDVKKMILLK